MSEIVGGFLIMTVVCGFIFALWNSVACRIWDGFQMTMPDWARYVFGNTIGTTAVAAHLTVLSVSLIAILFIGPEGWTAGFWGSFLPTTIVILGHVFMRWSDYVEAWDFMKTSE